MTDRPFQSAPAAPRASMLPSTEAALRAASAPRHRWNRTRPVKTAALRIARWGEINGVADTWFCGAYWHNGFHEDGVVSALRVVSALDNRSSAAA